MLERVQRRATRMIEECNSLGYEERLKITGLTTLETRRIRADLIEVYKVIKQLENVDEKVFFKRYSEGTSARGASVTRGNSCKLETRRCRLDVTKYSFGNRVVKEWNQLPDQVVQATTLNNFKNKVDHFLRHNGGLI